jgi:hypothetical protein
MIIFFSSIIKSFIKFLEISGLFQELQIMNKTIVNIGSIIGIPLFLLGLIISLTLAYGFGNYSILLNTISELGSIHYTNYPMAINITFMVSASFLSFFFIKLFKKVHHKAKSHRIYNFLSIFGFALLEIMTGSFFLVGIFNVDISYILHITFAIMVFISLLFAELIFGFLILRLKVFPKHFGYFMALGHISVALLFPIMPQALLEWCMFFVLLIWGIPLSVSFALEGRNKRFRII